MDDQETQQLPEHMHIMVAQVPFKPNYPIKDYVSLLCDYVEIIKRLDEAIKVLEKNILGAKLQCMATPDEIRATRFFDDEFDNRQKRKALIKLYKDTETQYESLRCNCNVQFDFNALVKLVLAKDPHEQLISTR